MKEKIYAYLKLQDKEFLITKISIEKDGSLIFSNFPQNSKCCQSLKIAINNKEFFINELEKTSIHQDVHITYHITGQVNYHGTNYSKSKIFESLNNIKNTNIFYNIIIPKNLIKQSIKTKECKCTFMLPNNELNHVGISFMIEPINHLNNGIIINTDYQITFLFFSNLMLDNILKKYNYQKILVIYPDDKFNLKSRVTAETKLKEILNYKKKLYSLPNGGIYFTNGNYEIIFSTIMRTRPKVKIEFEDPNLYAKLCSEKKQQTRFHSYFMFTINMVKLIINKKL